MLVLKRVEFLDLDRLTFPEESDDDGESHSHFRGSHGDDEKHKHVAIHDAVITRECDETEGGGVEHQLETHVDHEGVLTQEDSEESKSEQQPADDEIVIKTDGPETKKSGCRNVEVSSRMARGSGLPSWFR